MGRKRKLRRAGLLDEQPKVEVKPEPTAAPVVEVEIQSSLDYQVIHYE
jgi:hypothetical protein